MVVFFICLICIVLLIILAPSGIFFAKLFLKRGRTEEQCRQRLEKKGMGPALQWFDQAPWKETAILTADSFKLYAKYLDAGKGKAAIIVHGYRTNHYSGAYYAKIFFEAGYSVLVYDQRSHGRSPGQGITLGYKEKYDLDCCVQYAVTLGNHAIILHGESMGTAVCIQFLAAQEKKHSDYLKGAVLNCGFSNAKDAVIRWQRKYFKLPIFPYFYIVNILNRLFNGFWLSRLDCVSLVKKIKIPLFYIHGLEDDLLPPSMSRLLYDATLGTKLLWEVPNARHAQSCNVNPREYQIRIQEFLKMIEA